MKRPAFLLEWIDSLNERCGKAVSWLILVLVAECAIDLILRKVTGRGLFWAFDMNYMIYGTQFMLAGAYTLKHNAHVRVDVIYNLFSPRGRAILECIFYICLLFPMSLFLINACWEHFTVAVAERMIGIVSAWHPPIYPFKAVMPVTFALLFLQGVAIFVRSLATIIKVKGVENEPS